MSLRPIATRSARFPVACGIVEPLHGARSLGELERIKHELWPDGVVWHNRSAGPLRAAGDAAECGASGYAESAPNRRVPTGRAGAEHLSRSGHARVR